MFSNIFSKGARCSLLSILGVVMGAGSAPSPASAAETVSVSEGGAPAQAEVSRLQLYASIEKEAAKARMQIATGQDPQSRVAKEGAAQDAADPDLGLMLDGLKFVPLGGSTEINMKELRGKVVMVDMWSTTCPPCRKEIPVIREVYEKYQDQGFVVLGISMDTDKQSLADFCLDEGVTWPQYFDPKTFKGPMFKYINGEFKKKLPGIPVAMLFDKEGKLVTRSAFGERLEPMVKQLLGIKD